MPGKTVAQLQNPEFLEQNGTRRTIPPMWGTTRHASVQLGAMVQQHGHRGTGLRHLVEVERGH